jgi:hypothetical protein
MTKRKIEYWVIPPDQDAEFVACMEDVLETYEKAYDPQQPVLCMDEQPVQLLKETRVPIEATKEHGERVDYEYERNGTASIFLFAEPLSGFRQATARARRTKTDWAREVAHLLDTRYGDCAKVTLVCDNLNTHTKGAFYEAFEPEIARAYVKRIDFHYTPGRVEQTARLVTLPTPPPESPIIGLPALLQLVDWFHARRLKAQHGGPSCLDIRAPLSPPAPDCGSFSAEPAPALADAPRRKPRANPQRSQPRRRPAPDEAPGRTGGDA